jgi:3-oxoacyl-[acyl-carrier-protein] synthase-3
VTATPRPAARAAGYLGFGYEVPQTVIGNQDPRFVLGHAAQHGGISEAELFTGLRERRRLDEDDSVEAMMARAARKALDDAGLAPGEVERVYGYASPSAHLSPNGLYRVHRLLGLPRTTTVFPIHTDLTNFVAASVLAREAIAVHACERALVVIGGAWTRVMDYRSPHAVSIGDGAAAMVVGPSERFAIVDHVYETWSEDEETMVLDVRELDGVARPVFALSDEGVRSFVTNGVEVPPRLVRLLLERNGVRSDQITLVTHQASRRLMDAWESAIRPAVYASTLEEYGNMALATVGVTLAHVAARVRTEYIAVVAMGMGVHFSGMLIRR